MPLHNTNLQCTIYKIVFVVLYLLFLIVLIKCKDCLIVLNISFGGFTIIYCCINCICIDDSDEDEEYRINSRTILQAIREIETTDQLTTVTPEELSPTTITQIGNMPDVDTPPPPPSTSIPQLTILIGDDFENDSDVSPTYSPIHSPNSPVECAICLSFSPKHMRILRCNHSFHRRCIREWKKKDPVCPLCRDPL